MTDARGLKIKPGDCVIHVQAEALENLINFRLKGVKKW